VPSAIARIGGVEMVLALPRVGHAIAIGVGWRGCAQELWPGADLFLGIDQGVRARPNSFPQAPSTGGAHARSARTAQHALAGDLGRVGLGTGGPDVKRVVRSNCRQRRRQIVPLAPARKVDCLKVVGKRWIAGEYVAR